MKAFDKTIQFYIFDGNPSGRIMCELSNWNGRAYKVSRSDLSLFEKRDDSHNTGVYFLIGKDEDNSDTIYIGEAEDIIKRLKQHLTDKTYWNDCIVVLSKDNNLNKAHVKYLEHEFYKLAKDANRFIVTNQNIPQKSSISEFDEAMLGEFIENAKLLVNTLGYKAFETINDSLKSSINQKSSVKYFIKAARGAQATGIPVPDGFAILKGSKMAISTTPSLSDYIAKWRNKLLNNETVNSDYVFIKDFVFSSPSLAASVVMGRNANGKTEWKTEENKSLSDSI